MADLEWRVICLEHDEPSVAISDFFQRVFTGIEKRELIVKNPIKKDELKKYLERLIIPGDKKLFFTLGHSISHHYTYGFTTNFANKLSERYAYVHIDAHHDFHTSESGLLGCGHFVSGIIKDSAPNIEIEPLLIGVSPNEIKNIKQIDSSNKSKYRILIMHLQTLPSDVYISIDVDVLDKRLIHTGYKNQQGDMKLTELFSILGIIKKRKRIIGADIVGSSCSEDIQGHFIYAYLTAYIIGLDIKGLEEKRKSYPEMSLDYFNLKKFFN